MSDELLEYRVTFGSQYARDEHPRWKPAHPDGWLAIMAPNEWSAREIAFAILGPAWAFMYGNEAGALEDVDWSHFPLGELARITYQVNRTAVPR